MRLKLLQRSAAAIAGLAVSYLLFARTLVAALEQQLLGGPLHIYRTWPREYSCHVTVDVVPVAVLLLTAGFAVWSYLHQRGRVYLLDFACYKPPKSLQVTLDQFLWGSTKFESGQGEGFLEESIEFQRRISSKNGLSESTSLPPALHQDPPSPSLDAAREEAKMVLFGAVEEVLGRTGLKPRDIDFLVLNCSLFNPTPSLSAMVINHFKMRSNIISYNLAGMGCSAGIISIDLARRLLRLSPNKNALVLSTENITQNWYTGNDRSMLIPNTLFRMGGAAIVLTNKPRERKRAKYELQHVVRVHLGADDTAYECVFQKEDEAGNVGVTLTKDIVKVAANALQRNLTTLGPLVLPWSEQLKFAFDFLLRKMGVREGKPYVPDFRKAFDHFCLHAGGRGVIEGLGGQLRLSKRQLEPSFSSLFWFGNTSSASYWYGFAYAESQQGITKGDKVWQVGFGSGFKTNSAVWRALRSFRDSRHTAWADIRAADVETMWQELEAMGCHFVDGIMPAHKAKQKPAKQPDKNGRHGPTENGTHENMENEKHGPAENGCRGQGISKESAAPVPHQNGKIPSAASSK